MRDDSSCTYLYEKNNKTTNNYIIVFIILYITF